MLKNILPPATLIMCSSASSYLGVAPVAPEDKGPSQPTGSRPQRCRVLTIWLDIISKLTAFWRFCFHRSEGHLILLSLYSSLPLRLSNQVVSLLCCAFLFPNLVGSVFWATVLQVLLMSLSVSASWVAPADSYMTRCYCITYLC